MSSEEKEDNKQFSTLSTNIMLMYDSGILSENLNNFINSFPSLLVNEVFQ